MLTAEREPKWADVVKHVEHEIETLRTLLEAAQPEPVTQQLRGEIRAYRRLLSELGPKQPVPPEKMLQPDPPLY